MRLLLVEDEARVARFVARGLREAAYAVDVASDGEECESKSCLPSPDEVFVRELLIRGKPCSQVRTCCLRWRTSRGNRIK